MGAFSEQFKLSKRIRQADFGREKTREYWITWANGMIDRVSRVDKFEIKEESCSASRVDKFEVSEEDQVLESGSFEEVVNDK
jgi:hypothetical protein